MPRTFRELLWAYRGHEYAEWERLSSLLCLIANVNRDPKKPAVTPQHFFRRPGTRRPTRGTPLTGDALRAMKSIFVKRIDQ
jgi:hypothetical protein